MLYNVGVDMHSDLFAFYASLSPLQTYFDGELDVIKVATEQITVRIVQLENIVILSDSLSPSLHIMSRNQKLLTPTETLPSSF
ncbi:hypothetical protein CEXT_683701 [Caerostris extrusa]|uniref:Uncharacterized protein n=1 Tax=Caerostris extrusa TaxID=172846 RepID=A0AAV4Q2D8_CAEEX|nr:hypothetical protein CEXT_683701 [Caerostris extrusa]